MGLRTSDLEAHYTQELEYLAKLSAALIVSHEHRNNVSSICATYFIRLLYCKWIHHMDHITVDGSTYPGPNNVDKFKRQPAIIRNKWRHIQLMEPHWFKCYMS